MHVSFHLQILGSYHLAEYISCRPWPGTSHLAEYLVDPGQGLVRDQVPGIHQLPLPLVGLDAHVLPDVQLLGHHKDKLVANAKQCCGSGWL